MDHEEASKDHLAVGSAVLTVLWTFGDTWFEWLAAGQAVERILTRTKLYCTYLGGDFAVSLVSRDEWKRNAEGGACTFL